ncbi:MAG TPA: sensor histidine kinase, partial [Oligoflexia bacterium]|nr:sensor histidine kinase [Oligoflexia bacterium]
DRFMIQRVLANLVENAILHGTDATVIEITAGQTGREIEFSIRDNGKGIPAAALPNVFEPFVRASDEYHTGSGLGLAIVRRILEAHGSKIDVESSAGNGTCFHFRLQTAQPAS